MRVCVVVEPSPFTYTSGYKNRFQALFQYLHDIQDDVEVVTTEVVAQDRPTQWLGYPVHHTCGFRLPGYQLLSLSVDWTFKVGRVLNQMRPDIIHVSSPGLLVIGAVGWSRLFGIPLVMSYHTHLPVYIRSYIQPPALSGFLEWLCWKCIKLVHTFADLTVVTSRQVLQDFGRQRIPRCDVWQKGIDTEKFHPRYRNETMRERMANGNNGNSSFLMAYIGRLAPEKRLKELREVLRNMPADTRLCFVGAGTQEEELRLYFADEDRCEFTGQLEGDELSQAFASADVFCMPSDSETLGFVVLESMASGVPVIGVKSGGVQDLIHDGITGFLVEPGDTQAFVNRLLLLKNDKQLRATMAQNGRRETEQWSWGASMAKLRNEQYTVALSHFGNRWSQRLRRRVFRRQSSRSRTCLL